MSQHRVALAVPHDQNLCCAFTRSLESLLGDDLILIAKESITKRHNKTRVVILCALLIPMRNLSASTLEEMRTPSPKREVCHAVVQEL